MKRWADVQERFPSISENPIAEADAVFSLSTDPSSATLPNMAGWVLVTDVSLFVGVHGPKGKWWGPTKSVHRILLDEIQKWEAGQRTSNEYVLTLHDGETILSAILRASIHHGSDAKGVIDGLPVLPTSLSDVLDEFFPL